MSMDVRPDTSIPLSDSVRITVENATILGDLLLPAGASAIVVFAHGSGSSRLSPRNRFVADLLRRGGLGTLLIDLFTEQEEVIDERTRALRFDIDLLAGRLKAVTRALKHDRRMAELAIGYFGASTGAAAAIVAAAELAGEVQAVVSRGGRPDLAGDAIERVQCATLLIVGGMDRAVIELNQEALSNLRAPIKELAIVPGASHLFEEKGALEQVAKLAAQWFDRYLIQASRID